MIDITIIGGGALARACSDLLSAAGFGLRRTFEFDDADRSPIILAETPGAAAMARQAVQSGRHLLLATPALFSPDRLAMLYEGRRKAQALFLWSSRRYHPSYRFVSGLMESDSTWQPRFLRHESFLVDPPAAGLANWTLVESTGLVLELAAQEARSLSASAALNPLRNANELMTAALTFPSTRAFLQVSLGEAVERRETLIASDGRKVFIDELNQSMPVRIVTDETRSDPMPARWLSTAGPTLDDFVRQQCLAFLDSTLHPSQTQDEARLWAQALAIFDATQQSLANRGAEVRIEPRASQTTAFRLLPDFKQATL